ncbi:MAG: hypothetical protein C0179_04295 [Fervidicoccus sp.]|nr:MAG: hypothetical protein C0179_04295 [Fervidicoccus sp.]
MANKNEFVEFLDQLLDYESIANLVMKSDCPVTRIYYNINEQRLETGCFSSPNDDLSYEELQYMVRLFTWKESDETWISDEDLIEGKDDELYKKYLEDQADPEFPRESFVYYLQFNYSQEYLRRLKEYIIENMMDQDLKSEWIEDVLARVKNQ